MRDHLLADELETLGEPARVHFLLDGILARLEALHAGGTAAGGLDVRSVKISATDEITLEATTTPTSAGETPEQHDMFAFGLVMRDVLVPYFEHERPPMSISAECCQFPPSKRLSAAEARRQLAALGWQGPVTPWRPRFEPSDPRERDLIASLTDDAARQVYADWLEQHGFEIRAAFVRAELANAKSVAPDGDVLWRAAVSRAPIAGCRADGCPRRWDLLPRSDDHNRTCGTCNLPVHYCATQVAVWHRGSLKQPIAVDARLDFQHASAEYERHRNPPPRPIGNPPPPANPPAPRNEPGEAKDSGVLARFFGWFQRK